MKNFIVWSKNLKKFIKEDYMFFVSSDGLLCARMKNGQMVSDGDTVCFEGVGINDINNNPIYADCSVNYFNGDWIKDVGVFKWDDEYLRYEFHLEGEKEIVPFDPSYFDSMEIIDTIQENKLGLKK